MSMDVLELIDKNFSLTPSRWKQTNELLESDCGVKRVRYWSDEALMNWHHAWRNQAEHDQVLVDRMHHTVEGRWFVPLEDGFLTLHDVYFDSFPKQNHEHIWGRFIGEMLAFGVEHPHYQGVHESTTLNILDNLEDSNRMDTNLTMIRKSLPEAKRRLNMVQEIFEQYRHLPKPILESSLSVNQGKRVHGYLFWQGGNHYPEAGLQGVGSLLADWHQSTDTRSVHALLDHIDDRFTLTGGYDQLIVAELIAPREVQKCMGRMENAGPEQSKQILDRFEQEWETNLRLVEEVYAWINRRAKKVIR
ncbi:hypothetical protein [Alkalihalobacillus sp. AL-G]|uniref:hypothetical protein n=1 Tax=Alkalihalobacillus sp. AL-G TaxID=2926399 RepID=UPI00272994DF|nr:hypothetical protein [Alkalihalobacillus sp. AL-G]WLD92260.1 hypothetical protein MOJ78_14690 [Alkalihalobacillus sp. AL-G]